MEIPGLRPGSFPAEPKRINPEIVLLPFSRPVNVELSEIEIVNGHTAPTPWTALRLKEVYVYNKHKLSVMAILVVCFQTGDTKSRRFLPKNQHTHRE